MPKGAEKDGTRFIGSLFTCPDSLPYAGMDKGPTAVFVAESDAPPDSMAVHRTFVVAPLQNTIGFSDPLLVGLGVGQASRQAGPTPTLPA